MRNPASTVSATRFAVALVLMAGCGDRDHADLPLEEGRAELQLVNPPSDARCVQITVAGSRTVTKQFDLVSGHDVVFTLTSLPLGPDTFSDVAFDATCAALTAGQLPTWVSDPVVTVVAAGVLAHVNLSLHRDGHAVVTSTFTDDPDGSATGLDAGVPPDGTPPDASVVFGPASTGRVRYYGGPVIEHVKVVAVFWGANVDVTTQATASDFFKAITNSPYLDWLSEYNTTIKADNGANGTAQVIGRGSFVGSLVITPGATAGVVDDSRIQNELLGQIVAGGPLPLQDPDALYVIYLPAGTDVSFQGAVSCQSFCAYHSSLSFAGASVRYAVIPHQGGCASSCGPGTVTQNTEAWASHELVEAITDPDIDDGSTPGSPDAWLSASAGEIGDICEQQQATLLGFTVQKIWSNLAQACIVSR